MTHKLARHLKRLGISAADCSGRINIAQSALHRIMKQGKAPSLRTAGRIVAASNGAVTYEDLLPPSDKRHNKTLLGLLT